MIEWYDFLLKSSIVLLVFYAVYWFLLRKGTHFKHNRIYLLVGLLFSLILPFLSFQLPDTSQTKIMITLDSIDIGAVSTAVAEQDKGISFVEILQIIYFSIAAILLLRLLLQFYLLLKLYRQSERETVGGIKVFITDKQNAVFSFFKFVFANTNARNSDDFNAVLQHEHVHIVQKHSVDIVLAELLTIVLWFNPFAWLYKKSIKENHEFLADEGVLGNGYSADRYQKLLFEQSTGLHLSLANSFNQSLTFKRLNMMKKIKSNKWLNLKVIISVPVIVAMVVFISCSKELANIAPETNKPENEQFKKTMALSAKDTILFITEKMPEFPGGELGLRKYIAQNVKYPQEARINGIEGKVYVRFVVTKTGIIDHVTLARGVDSILDSEAIRVISTLPQWKPAETADGEKVNVWYTVPINFALQGSTKSDTHISPDKNTVEGVNVVSFPPKEKSESQTFFIVEKMPKFPGDEKGLKTFLATNLHYPDNARTNNIEGKVYVRYKVTSKGTVENVTIARGTNQELNEEAMRVVKMTSGKWTPGEQRGTKVDVWYTVPIEFKLK